jgi:hypothetical protein
LILNIYKCYSLQLKFIKLYNFLITAPLVYRIKANYAHIKKS